MQLRKTITTFLLSRYIDPILLNSDYVRLKSANTFKQTNYSKHT